MHFAELLRDHATLGGTLQLPHAIVVVVRALPGYIHERESDPRPPFVGRNVILQIRPSPLEVLPPQTQNANIDATLVVESGKLMLVSVRPCLPRSRWARPVLS